MSVSTITHLNASGSSRTALTQQYSKESGAFAAMLSAQQQVEHIDAVKAHRSTSVQQGISGSGSSTNLEVTAASTSGNGAHFAQVLSSATNSMSPAAPSLMNGPVTSLNTETSFDKSELFLYQTLQSYQHGLQTSGLTALNGGMNTPSSEATGEVPVELNELTLDFSSLLPMGSRAFIKDLKCTPEELNNFVNLMVFGVENGPQGKNAAEYFGATSLSASDLSASLKKVLATAQVNSQDVTGDDFNFVLRQKESAIGQTIAIEQGQSLESRALEHNLDHTFKRDMALMQILARSNNQSAGLF